MKRSFLFWGIVSLVMAASSALAYEPELVNNLMVSETVGSCEADRVFFAGTNRAPYPDEFDVCDRYQDEGKSLDYGGPGPEDPQHWVGSVTGINWPSGMADAQYAILPYGQGMDRPADPEEPPINTVRFVQGASDFKRKSFSYFIYDMTDKRGCEVISARLRFKTSPWYSSSAQTGNVTVYVGLYDMDHACENLTNDGKRGCFGNLVNAANNPLQIQFPHSWTDYEYFEIDVTESVQADLYDADASGYVGFLIGSQGFGEHDIDYAPGVRNLGMTAFILEVELGPCAAPPTVTNVNPSSGPVAGGTAVTITGTNFVNGATVTFGGTAATGVVFQSATSITAVTPAHAAGQVDVTVTNPDTQSGTLTNGFRYESAAPPPTVTNVNPSSGPVAGGTAVTITGTNFLGEPAATVEGRNFGQAETTVTFGGIPATGVTVLNSTTITAVTPAHAAGQVDVTVTNPDTQSGTLANSFNYLATPIPTLQEWGMIVFVLLMLMAGFWTFRKRSATILS